MEVEEKVELLKEQLAVSQTHLPPATPKTVEKPQLPVLQQMTDDELVA